MLDMTRMGGGGRAMRYFLYLYKKIKYQKVINELKLNFLFGDNIMRNGFAESKYLEFIGILSVLIQALLACNSSIAFSCH